MEINESNNLDSLRDALTYFYEKTKSRVTFEYIIFDGFNDELSDARELAEFAKCVPCKINKIEYFKYLNYHLFYKATVTLNLLWLSSSSSSVRSAFERPLIAGAFPL